MVKEEEEGKEEEEEGLLLFYKKQHRYRVWLFKVCCKAFPLGTSRTPINEMHKHFGEDNLVVPTLVGLCTLKIMQARSLYRFPYYDLCAPKDVVDVLTWTRTLLFGVPMHFITLTDRYHTPTLLATVSSIMWWNPPETDPKSGVYRTRRRGKR